MKKLSLILLCASALSLAFSCEEPKGADPVALATPVASVTVDGTVATITWNAVENAASYEYNYLTTPTETTETSVAITQATPGTYEVKIKALPEAGSKEYLASEAATVSFTIEVPFEATYDDYLGTWTLVATRTHYFQDDSIGQIEQIVDEETYIDVIVHRLEDGEGLVLNDGTNLPTFILTGLIPDWNDVDNGDVATQLALFVDEDVLSYELTTSPLGSMDIMSGFPFMEDANIGAADLVDLSISAECSIEGSEDHNLVGGNFPMLTVNLLDKDGKATVSHYEGELTDGKSFRAEGYWVVGSVTDGSGSYYRGFFPSHLGPYSIEKVGTRMTSAFSNNPSVSKVDVKKAFAAQSVMIKK